jgi:hypothetical protein
MLTDIEASRGGAGGGDVISTVGSGRGQRGSARLEEGGRPRHAPVTNGGVTRGGGRWRGCTLSLTCDRSRVRSTLFSNVPESRIQSSTLFERETRISSTNGFFRLQQEYVTTKNMYSFTGQN